MKLKSGLALFKLKQALKLAVLYLTELALCGTIFKLKLNHYFCVLCSLLSA